MTSSGTPVSPSVPEQRGGRFRRIILLGGGGLLALCVLCTVIVAIFGPDQDEDTTDQGAPEATSVAVADATEAPEPAATAPAEQEVAAIGDEIETEDWVVTISDVRRTDELTWNDRPLTPDGQWLIVRGEVRNLTTDPVRLQADDFAVTVAGLTGEVETHRDATGAAGLAAGIPHSVAGFGGYEITGGETAPLVVAFEIPRTSDAVTLRVVPADREIALGNVAEIALLPTPTPTETPPPTDTPPPTETPGPTDTPEPPTATPAPPTPLPAPASIGGTGTTITENFVWDSSILILRATHNGGSNFIISLNNADTAEIVDVLINEIGPFDGEVAIEIEPGTYFYEITADGAWSLTSMQPGHLQAQPSSAAYEFSGAGSHVTPLFALQAGRVDFTMTHNGSSNFIVTIFNVDAGRLGALLANDIGTVSLTRAETAGAATHFIAIRADGAWTVQISQP